MGVFWKPEECRQVAIQYLVEEAAGNIKTQAGRIEAAQRAVLPEDRWKPNIKGWSSVSKSLDPYMDYARRAFERARVGSATPAVESPAVEPPAVELPAVQSPAVQSAAVEPPTPPGSVEDAIVGAIKRIVLRVITDSDIRAALVQTLSGTPVPESAPRPPKHDPSPPQVMATVPPKLLKIAVLGVIGPQMTDLTETFRNRAQLRYWTVDEKAQAIDPVVNWCDVCVVFVGFVGHHVTTKVSALSKKNFGGFKVLLNTNGVSTAKALIERELAPAP